MPIGAWNRFLSDGVCLDMEKNPTIFYIIELAISSFTAMVPPWSLPGTGVRSCSLIRIALAATAPGLTNNTACEDSWIFPDI